MSAPSWPQLRGWAATASVRTLSGTFSSSTEGPFLFRAPDLWLDGSEGDGGSWSLQQLLRLDRHSVERTPALSVTAVQHDGRAAWRAELADGSAWVVDDETGLGLRAEQEGWVREVRDLRVDEELPPELLRRALARDAAERGRQALERLVRETPPPVPAWWPWRPAWSSRAGLTSLPGGGVGRAPAGEPAPVDWWQDGPDPAVRLERRGASWAVLADPPLSLAEAEAVVDGVLDRPPGWRPSAPPPASSGAAPAVPDRPAPGGPVPPPQGGTVLFDGRLPVHYGFYGLSSEDPYAEHEVRGQAQGLLAVATPGVVKAVSGMHTGDLPLRVELHDAEPPVQDGWEDVVEASFSPYEDAVVLSAFQDAEELPLPPGTYRVRLCVVGMDLGRAADTVLEDEPAVEHHRLQLWPEPAERPDALVRATSQAAAYWHGLT